MFSMELIHLLNPERTKQNVQRMCSRENHEAWQGWGLVLAHAATQRGAISLAFAKLVFAVELIMRSMVPKFSLLLDITLSAYNEQL